MCTSLWLIWPRRNDDLHTDVTARRVVAPYEKANHVLAADKDLFTISLETRLNFLIRELTWLGQVSHTDR
jgi:hypothetical protein